MFPLAALGLAPNVVGRRLGLEMPSSLRFWSPRQALPRHEAAMQLARELDQGVARASGMAESRSRRCWPLGQIARQSCADWRPAAALPDTLEEVRHSLPCSWCDSSMAYLSCSVASRRSGHEKLPWWIIT